MKKCARCLRILQESEFTWIKARNKPQSQCKPCRNQMNRDFRASNPEKMKKYSEQKKLYNKSLKGQASYLKSHLKRFGITIERKIDMYALQHGRCAICLRLFIAVGSACVDHCHQTGRVRKLLCKPCNGYVGKIESDPKVLKNLIDYLEKNS